MNRGPAVPSRYTYLLWNYSSWWCCYIWWYCYIYEWYWLKCGLQIILRWKSYGHHIGDIISKCSFLTEFFFSIQISLKFVLNGLNWQVGSGSGNGLVPNNQQAITWNNGRSIHRCMDTSPGPNVLIRYIWGQYVEYQHCMSQSRHVMKAPLFHNLPR